MAGTAIRVNIVEHRGAAAEAYIRTRIVMDFWVKAVGPLSPLLRFRDSAVAGCGSRVFAADEEAAGRCAVAKGSCFVADTIMRQTVQRAVRAKHGSSGRRCGGGVLCWGCCMSAARVRRRALALHDRPITEAHVTFSHATDAHLPST